MLRIVVLLSVACVAWASICCVPRQWEGTEGTALGLMRDGAPQPNFIQSSINVAYDANNQRVAATQYIVVDDFQTMVKVIMDYKQGIQYSINGTRCTKTTLPPFQENCIPDGAQETDITLGAGGKTLTVKTYTMTVGNLTVNAQVTENGCIPVSESIVGRSPGEFIHMGTSYSGITPGISDPSVFTPPASCMSGPVYPAEVSALKRVAFLHLL
ncbi:ependymin-related protein 1-like [Crassostrea virginica]|uniref:Mammalian ependymin-related protein 1-like n=1 Tax=Crassostrea virginica TaxID=6565 RepID=A0A8B8CI75_CRAVI|nr:mammalian ependymin-related protein 1-like [Crassostrea virginica]